MLLAAGKLMEWRALRQWRRKASTSFAEVLAAPWEELAPALPPKHATFGLPEALRPDGSGCSRRSAWVCDVWKDPLGIKSSGGAAKVPIFRKARERIETDELGVWMLDVIDPPFQRPSFVYAKF